MLEIGCQAFDVLAKAGCEQFALVEGAFYDVKSSPKRADGVGIVIDRHDDGEGWETLFVCRDGRLAVAYNTKLVQIAGKYRWFSDKPKDCRLEGRRIYTLHSSEWVGVTVRDGLGSPPIASYPANCASAYVVYAGIDCDELLTMGLGEYFQRPFVDDLAGKVANIVESRPRGS